MANVYRYNGKELDEATGLYDYGARYYDPAIGRFPSIDRFAEKFAYQSPYVYAGNNPIKFIDINGDSVWITHRKETYLYDNGNLFLNGEKYTDETKGFLRRTVDALNTLGGTAEGGDMLTELQGSTNNFTIVKGRSSKFTSSNKTKAYANQILTDPDAETTKNALLAAGKDLNGGSGGTIVWNPSGASLPTVDGFLSSGTTDLGHELFHASDANRGMLDSRKILGLAKREWVASTRENILRRQLGLPFRTHYSSKIDNSTSPATKTGTGPSLLLPFISPNF